MVTCIRQYSWKCETFHNYRPYLAVKSAISIVYYISTYRYTKLGSKTVENVSLWGWNYRNIFLIKFSMHFLDSSSFYVQTFSSHSFISDWTKRIAVWIKLCYMCSWYNSSSNGKYCYVVYKLQNHRVATKSY